LILCGVLMPTNQFSIYKPVAMLRLSLFLLLLTSLSLSAQQTQKNTALTCTLSGTVLDEQTNDPIPFVNVLLYFSDSSQVATATTDLDGRYAFRQLAAGSYKLKVSYIGYTTKTISGIAVTTGTPVALPVKLATSQRSVILSEVTVANENVKLTNTAYQEIRTMAASPSGKAYYYKGRLKDKQTADFDDYNREGYNHIQDNGFKDSKHDPLSTFSIDVDRASYSNVRRFLNQGVLPPADAVRVEEMINYFSYQYPQPAADQPFSITTKYTSCPWNSKHNMIHIGLQGKDVKLDHLPPNNLTFLIDVSGSMSSEDKLPLLKSGLRLLIEQMRAEDKVSLVVYAGAAGLVLPPTSGEHKDRIFDALDKLQSGGSTAGGAGIALAYKTARENYDAKGNNRIILATDGDFNVGASSDGELVRMIEKEREHGVFLSVLGFGTGNYQDGKMEQLADKGNGNYAYIDNILEAKKVLVKEMGGTLLTIAKDVKLQIEFNPAKVKAYRLVGYENRLLNKEDFNDDKKDAGELGAGHTVTAIYEIIPAGSDEVVASTDALKYQQTATSSAAASSEVMTIKFRYKEPTEKTSKLISHVVHDNKVAFTESGDNCRFSAAVAEFGMLLRNSEYKGSSDFKSVLSLARSAKGKDEEGYRAEFIRLVEMAELLKK